MENILCSDNFRKFFGEIDKMGLTTEQIASVVRDNMPLIAQDISLGSLICEFYAPASPIEKEGTSAQMIMYQSEKGASEETVVHAFSTGGGGRVTFTASPAFGHVWSDSEKEEILFLCKSIFVMCGRSRLSDIIGNTLSKDVSTGLFNANGFVSAGNRLVNEGRLHEYAAMYLNLRNFKYINGQLGNKQGDLVIKTYADTLAGAIGTDGVVARLGGDNFTILIKKERTDEILKLISGVELDIEYGGVKSHFCIQARAGIYYINEEDKMSHVMNCISAAVSAARRHPTDHIVVFTPEVLYKIMHEQEIASIFPAALREREFVVYYQPKVSLENEEICGCEALVRWLRNGKLVPPMDFIPLFERNGSICALDFYVLDSVCRSICQWKAKGLEPVTVSVNFSKTHLHNPNIAEDILEIIEKYGIESRYIEIEMTEMSDYGDYDAFKNLVTKLKNGGVKTSIDDFGTGYSSLNLLTDFMFDIVKLDKSFLDNIIRNSSRTDEIVVRHIVKMVKELDMKAIAEGVETAEQARFLREIDCNMVQGYLFDKPLPEEEFVKRLESRKYGNIL